ncbi:sensor histidine kinase [Nocardioides albus]|uniref:histidine kinase n=1 Tax=Nocardioides albus TaxID=1841 RepID=A0A7W5F8V1_9ACTN|nr:sensor histidine kinase [Nocardioides albus]MBB3089619.1 sensor histidine kinase regulating citrate/malate metabolism [Nocardioides albus]GGU30600.1 histidine kinase [Nocardioides albus]
MSRTRPARHRLLRDRPVAQQVLLLQFGTVLLLVVTGILMAAYDAQRDSYSRATQRAVAVAQTVADSPTLTTALSGDEPTTSLQPWTSEVRRDTDTDFVVVMALDRTRYTHTDPDQIGGKFVGDLGGAPEGEVFTQQYTGTLGPSVRSVVPVEDDGEVVALVSVGITVSDINRGLQRDVGIVLVCGGLVLFAGLLGAWLLSRRLHRLTHGMGERELARMYEYYSAVLHSVREGLLLLDGDGRVQLVNDEARRLLALPDDVVGTPIEDLDLAPGLVAAARGRTVESDDLYLAGERILVVSSAPARWDGREVGAVVTLRDHTELRSVTGELEVVRRFTESLRSQNHEAANRLHTVVSLIEMGRSHEAVEFATEELQVAQLLTDQVVGAVEDPVVAALLLGKSAEAAERGIDLRIEGEWPSGSSVAPRDLVTVLGNLVDNAFDAVADMEPRQVEVRLTGDDATLTVRVGDSGPGLDEADSARVLDRGWTTKAEPGTGRGLGLALVAQIARRHGGAVAVGRSHLGGAEFTVTLATEAAA